jgi:hypothetical protein
MAADIDQSRRNKKPRPLQEGERTRLDEFIDSIGYSARYDAMFLKPLSRMWLTLKQKVLRQSIRISPCPTTKSDAQSHSSRLLRPRKRYTKVAVGGGVARPRNNAGEKIGHLTRLASLTDRSTEPRLGTLRSSRTRATHSSLQVSQHASTALSFY